MAFNKRTWKGRQGVGLNKFSINGASPVTVVNQPDSITEVGDALSAGNLNDLEDRIADAFDETASQEEVTDVKNALTAVDHRVQNLESAKGDYVAVDSTKGVIITPSGKGKWAVVEKLRGVSRARNNLFPTRTLSYTSKGLTVTSNNDGTISISGTTNATGVFDLVSDIGSTYNGVSYVIGLNLNVVSGSAPSNSTYGFKYGDSMGSGFFYGDAVATAFATVLNSQDFMMNIYATNVAINITLTPIITDLRKYFNTSDISFLGANDSSKLATIQQYYPWLLEPSDYGSSLVDSVYEGVRSTFKNLAQINSFTQSTSYGQTVPCELRRGVTYTVSGTASGGSTMRLLKSDGSYQYVAITATINATFVAEDDISEASFYGSLTVSSLQIEQGSSKTTFSEYHAPSTLSLPTPITLRSAGSVAEEFDLETGEKTNPLGSVDLGTLTWYYESANTRFYSDLTDAKPTISENPANYLCAKYVNVSPNVFDLDVPNMAMRGGVGSGMVWIRDTSYNDATTFKNAMNGVILYYEKATALAPTQLTPIQNPTILTESGGTISAQTEEPIDGNFSVGFITL